MPLGETYTCLAVGLHDGAPEARGFLRNGVFQPLQEERHHLAPMAADDLQPGMPVEGAREQHAHDLDARLVVPAPGEHGQARAELSLEAAVVRRLHRGERQAGVHVQRHLQFAERRKDRLVARIVQEGVAGAAVDERALQAELFHRPLQLARGRLGRLPRQRGKTREARGMRPRRFGQLVVGRAVQRDGLRCGQQLREPAIGEHLHVDAGGIHVGQARRAHLQPLARGLAGRNDMRAARIDHVLAVHHAAAPVAEVRRLARTSAWVAPPMARSSTCSSTQISFTRSP
jgi:hypothetical protein